jgi:hypothetical protein
MNVAVAKPERNKLPGEHYESSNSDHRYRGLMRELDIPAMPQS